MKGLRMTTEQFEAHQSGLPKKAKAEDLPLEHDEQVQVMKFWRGYAAVNRLNEKLLFCIPNASALSHGGRLYKYAEGLTAGVYDLFLAIPRGGKHGFFIEMKRGKRKPSDDQFEFGKAVNGQGYAEMVAYSAKEAIDAMVKYLGTTDSPPRP